mmetsp:Transcript_2809/g.11044  ORF Transcript_2809/g.11044 Transcript_2809/m.11044 type:complete len:201 (-) Transcript_2809:1827-2429(-)
MVAPRAARAGHERSVQAPAPEPVRSVERRVPILGRGTGDHLGRVQGSARHDPVRGHGALRRHRRDGEPALVGRDDRGDGRHAQGRARIQRRGLRPGVPRRGQSRAPTLRTRPRRAIDREGHRRVVERRERRPRLERRERHRGDALGGAERRTRRRRGTAGGTRVARPGSHRRARRTRRLSLRPRLPDGDARVENGFHDGR